MPHSKGFDTHGDEDDYSCGSGVFWRYLLHGFNQSIQLRALLLDLVKKDPENNVICRSAEHAFDNVLDNGNKLFAYFNVLATLLAAIEILEAAQRDEVGPGVILSSK